VVSVRSRVNKANEGTFSVEEFISRIKHEIENRTLPQAAQT